MPDLVPPEPIGNRRRFTTLPGGGYRYSLIDEPLDIDVRYLRRVHGNLVAEIDVRCIWAGVRTHAGSLSCADLNLSSQTARKTLARYCAERARTKGEEFDWAGAVNAVCLLVIAAEREGDPVVVLDEAPTQQRRDFQICGLQIPADAASLLIAHGDSLKSLLLLFVLGHLAQQGQNVLFLDWEWSADRHLERKRRLFGATRLPGLRYWRCRAPLVVEADRIRRYCDDQGVTFLGVDSVGLACDGKLVDDDVAIRFYRALGYLPSALCAAHVPKSSFSGAERSDPTAFGSVYFHNLCRASWVVKKQEGSSDDVVTVGLFPTKQNDGVRTRPVGLEFTFRPDEIVTRSVDLATVEGLAERLPLSSRMRQLLRRGPMTYAALAEELEAKVNSVIQVAQRDMRFTKVQSADGITRVALVELGRRES